MFTQSINTCNLWGTMDLSTGECSCPMTNTGRNCEISRLPACSLVHADMPRHATSDAQAPIAECVAHAQSLMPAQCLMHAIA